MRDFTKGSIGSGLFLFGLPIVAGNLFQQLYMFVNSAIVGRFLGDVDLAAVGAVYPIVFFFVSLIIGIGSA
ncbi:MAG: MATE family efflux transporter, partial [Bacteroidales bacterium]|nr:MATE family efflux transporter [Bacteroidales bacterium]